MRRVSFFWSIFVTDEMELPILMSMKLCRSVSHYTTRLVKRGRRTMHNKVVGKSYDPTPQ